MHKQARRIAGDKNKKQYGKKNEQEPDTREEKETKKTNETKYTWYTSMYLFCKMRQTVNNYARTDIYHVYDTWLPVLCQST